MPKLYAYHKTMSSIMQQQLRLLVQLALADGEIAESEWDLIVTIGKANGLSDDEIAEAYASPEEIGDLSTLSPDQKFDYIFNIVQLMKVDGKLYQPEIKFVSKTATHLGYDEAVMFQLLTQISGDPKADTNKEALKTRVQRYLS